MLSFNWCGVEFKLADYGGGVLNHTIHRHCHSSSSYELHFITGGSGTLSTDSGDYALRRGNFFVTGPFFYHGQASDSAAPLTDVFLYIQKIRGKPEEELGDIFLKTHFLFRQDFPTAIPEEIIRELRENKPGSHLAARGLMITLLTQIARLYPGVKEAAPKPMETLNDKRFVIIENMLLYSGKFSLKELAEALGLCERQTQRLLKKYYGKTFRELTSSE